MRSRTYKLTRAAVFAALGTALLYIASVIPSGRLGVVAVAGLLTAPVLMSCGVWWAVGVFVVTGALAILTAPLKGAAVLYIAFLGYYPIVKSRFERMHSIPLEWLSKLATFNMALTVIWFLGDLIMISFEQADKYLLSTLIIYLVGNAMFVAYDLGLSGLIHYYIEKLSKYMDGKRYDK